MYRHMSLSGQGVDEGVIPADDLDLEGESGVKYEVSACFFWVVSDFLIPITN